jgi:hypothetical protein
LNKLEENWLGRKIWKKRKIECLDGLSTHETTTRQFDLHYPSTQQTVCCDNCACAILTPVWSVQVFFVHPSFDVDGFVTCNMTSSLLKMLCDIMSTLSLSKIWLVCHMFLRQLRDVLRAIKRKCRCFVAWFLVSFAMSDRLSCKMWPFFIWFLDTFMISSWLLSEKWTFPDMIFGRFVMSSRLSSKMWTFCHMIFGHICNNQPEGKRERFVTWIFPETFVMTNRLLRNSLIKKSQETVPICKMWTDSCLGGAVFYRQAHIRAFANQLSP